MIVLSVAPSVWRGLNSTSSSSAQFEYRVCDWIDILLKWQLVVDGVLVSANTLKFTSVMCLWDVFVAGIWWSSAVY